jgi:hypothetical protein
MVSFVRRRALLPRPEVSRSELLSDEGLCEGVQDRQ